jgi:hypothetical protein
MEPPTYGGVGPVPVGAVKAGSGIEIAADGTINVTAGGGTINSIVCTNGIQGGGSNPQVFIGLLPPDGTTLGGVYTIEGSGISIDQNGLIRASLSFGLQSGPGIVLSNVTPESATISAATAGNSEATIGSIFVNPAANPGVQVSPTGALSLTPPQNNGLGGVKAGSGCTINALTGVLDCTGSGGTITGVGTGTGLGGGGTSGAVTVFLRPAGYANPTNIGGVYAGDNVTIEADGRISVAADTGVQTVTGTSPVEIGGTQSNPVISVKTATSTYAGVVQLTNDPTTPDVNLAASASALNSTYNLANNALPRAGGSMSGPITFTAGQSFPGTVNSGTFTQLGGILVGDTSPPGYAQLPAGSPGQVLSVNNGTGLGLEWVDIPSVGTLQQVTDAGATTTNSISMTADSTLSLADVPGTTTALMSPRSVVFTSPSINGTASLTVDGAYPRLEFTQGAGIAFINYNLGSGIVVTADTPNEGLIVRLPSLETVVVNDNVGLQVSPALPFSAGGLNYPTADGTAGQALTTNGTGTLGFTSVLPLTGGTLTGTVNWAAGQTFPGVVQSIGASDSTINVGGTPENPLLDVAIATTSELGVVQPDGTTITIDGNGVITAVAAASGTLQTITDAGATTTNSITIGDQLSFGANASLSWNGTGMSLNSALTVSGNFQLSDGTFNYVQFFPDGRAYIEGPVGINDVPDPLYPLTLEGNFRSFGTDLTWVMDSTGGTLGALQFKESGTLAASITNTTGGDLVVMANSGGKSLILGASGAQYLSISGTDGQLTINSSTAGALSFPVTDGTTGQVLSTDGAGNIGWATPQVNIPQPDYGNFYSDNTQQPQALVTGQPVTLNQTVAANNFQIIDGSKVTASSAGVYNLQFSIQLVSTNQGGDVEIWLAKNGVAVNESNTYFHTKNPNEAEFAALNYVETLASGDYLELIWATDNIDMTLAATASTMGGPNIPSVILTIVPVGA